MSPTSRPVYEEPVEGFLKDRRTRVVTATLATVSVVVAHAAVIALAPNNSVWVFLPLIGSAVVFLAWHPVFVRQRLRVYEGVIEPARQPFAMRLRNQTFQVHSREIASVKVYPSRYGADWYGSIVAVLDSGAEVCLTAPFIGREAYEEVLAFVRRVGVKASAHPCAEGRTILK